MSILEDELLVSLKENKSIQPPIVHIQGLSYNHQLLLECFKAVAATDIYSKATLSDQMRAAEQVVNWMVEFKLKSNRA